MLTVCVRTNHIEIPEAEHANGNDSKRMTVNEVLHVRITRSAHMQWGVEGPTGSSFMVKGSTDSVTWVLTEKLGLNRSMHVTYRCARCGSSSSEGARIRQRSGARGGIAARRSPGRRLRARSASPRRGLACNTGFWIVQDRPISNPRPPACPISNIRGPGAANIQYPPASTSSGGPLIGTECASKTRHSIARPRLRDLQLLLAHEC